jgi:hypothetical protein
MNDEPSKPTFGQALAWAFQRLREELRTVLILTVFLIVILLISFVPVIGFYTQLLGGYFEGNRDPALFESLDFPGLGFLFTTVFAIIGSSAIYVLLSRLTDMDRARLLEGGFGVLINRALGVVWRLICATGWMMLVGLVMMIAIMIVLFVIGIPASLSMGEEGAAGLLIVISVPLYAVMVVLFVAIYGALSVSIYAASRDIKIGILATWKALKGCRRRLVIANVIVYLILVAAYVPIALLTGLMFSSMGVGAVIVYLALSSLLAGIYAFIWLGIGAAFANYALERA